MWTKIWPALSFIAAFSWRNWGKRQMPVTAVTWIFLQRNLFIHSIVCLTAVPKALPKRVLDRVRSSASSFSFQVPLFSLRSSTSCLRLFPRLPVTSILPSIHPSVICYRRQFIRNMWPPHFALPIFTVGRILLSSFTLCNKYFISHTSGPNDLLHPTPAPYFKNFQLLLSHIPNVQK